VTRASAAAAALAGVAFTALFRGGFVAGVGAGAALACLAVAQSATPSLAPSLAPPCASRDARRLARVLLIAAVLGTLALLPLPAGVRAFLAPGASALDQALGRRVGVGPLSLDPAATRGALLALALAGAVIAAARTVAASEAGRARLVVAIVAAASGVALLGIVETFLGRPLIHTALPPHARPFGPFANRNHAGVLLVTALPLALAATRSAQREGALGGRRGAARAWAAASALLALALLLDGSRGALLAGVGVGLFALATTRWRWRTKLLAGTALATALIVPSHAWTRRGDATTVAERVTLARDALRMARDAPFTGIGLGAFGAAYPPYQTVARDLRFRHVECEPIELLVEGGVPLLLLAAAAAGLLARTAWRVARRSTDRHATAIAAATLAVPLHALCDFPLRVPGVALPFLMLVGVLLALDATARPAEAAR